ncbi:MAG: ATP-binding protein [Bryobacteraceae bacterium]
MKVLAADDDAVFRLLVQKALRGWGHEPVVVSDGQQALEALTAADGPRLAILDWVMPGTDGAQTCRQIRAANLPHYVYIILLTGKTASGDVLAGLEAGADDYLAKPLNLRELSLRLRAGCRVLESEERHRLIAETASDGILTIEGEGTVRFANRAAPAIFGYAPGELAGMKFDDLAPEFECRLYAGTSGFAAADQLRTWHALELAGKHRSGTPLILEGSFAESRSGSQNRMLTAVIRDVTERRLQESQRAQAQKLESIGQLAAGVAHEINSPIQYVGDNLRFIQESCEGTGRLLASYRRLVEAVQQGSPIEQLAEESRRIGEQVDIDYLLQETPAALEAAFDGVSRVAAIVRAMKEYAHPDTAASSPTDLNHLLETTALLAKNKWKYVADLETRLDPTLPPVNCMASEVSQVFLNLIVNAADAIEDATRETPGMRGKIVLESALDDGFVEVRVKDTGMGIPPEIQSRIFDPFFTTKEVGRGTGQGLAIAYVIVTQKHGGTIRFETSKGVGTTFIVKLPIDRSANGPAHEAGTTEEEAEPFACHR